MTVDVTVYHRGFHGDLNETLFVGKVSEEAKKLVNVTWECLEKAIETGKLITCSFEFLKLYFVFNLLFLLCRIYFVVKPGMRYRDVGAVIQKHAQSHGFSVVRSYCGHGIHRLFHTAPNVPHYASKLNFFIN